MNCSRALAGTAERKFLSLITLLTALSFGISLNANAVPYNLTFTGKVTSISGVYAGQQYDVDDDIMLKFSIDFDEAPDPVPYISGGAPGPLYFARLQGGDLIIPHTYDPYLLGQVGYGLDCQTCSSRKGSIQGGWSGGANRYMSAAIYSYTTPVSSWSVGQALTAGVGTWENGNYYSTGGNGYSADVTLSSMTPVSTVPEPAGIWLLGSGFIAMCGLATRKKARKTKRD